MKKILILCAHRPNRSPSQRYRFEQYLSFLETEGFSFTFSPLLNEKQDRIFYAHGNLLKKAFILLHSIFVRIKDCTRFKQYDIIFIQREATFFGTSYFEKRAVRSGAYVIFDFDDSIWLADTSPGNKKWEWLKKPEKLFETLKCVHCVIAGNSYLTNIAKNYNSNCITIPTTIDTSFHVPNLKRSGKDITVIGWSGSISTIKHFLELVPVLKRVQEKYLSKVSFKVMADKIYVHETLKIEGVKWSAEEEVNILNSFDIGLMPLPDDEWSRGKCGLKGLSYMACGVATIMSPVGVNSEIIAHQKNGLLASTQEEWFEKICLLIDNPELRQRLGNEGRNTVVEKYSVESNRSKYFSIFNNAQASR